MTLEEYLRAELAEGKIDFAFRAQIQNHKVVIYIHPDSKPGRTTPTVQVKSNTLLLPEGWAVAATPVEHVCGLSGYNGTVDPPCPGCEASNDLRDARRVMRLEK